MLREDLGFGMHFSELVYLARDTLRAADSLARNRAHLRYPALSEVGARRDSTLRFIFAAGTVERPILHVGVGRQPAWSRDRVGEHPAFETRVAHVLWVQNESILDNEHGSG